MRLALVVTAALVAAALPSYGDAVGLMGGFVTALTAVQPPTALHLCMPPACHMHATSMPHPCQVLLPTAFYLAVHVGAAEAGEPPISAAQLIACALVVLGALLAIISPHFPSPPLTLCTPLTHISSPSPPLP